MISFFDNLVIKSNPQAKEEILSLKKPLATAKPKVKECMKRSRPSSDSTQMSGNSSGTSEGIDGENPSPPKKRDTRPHKGSGGAGGKGDPPEKPDKPGDSKVDNTEIIQKLLEELMVLLDQIRAKFEKMIAELHPEAQRILSKKFNEFYQHFWRAVQRFNQLPSNTSIEEIERKYQIRQQKMEQKFNDKFSNKIRNIIDANKEMYDIIQRVRTIFGANIDSLDDEASYTSAIFNFNELMVDVKENWIGKFNKKFAHAKNSKKIQSEIENFEKDIIKQFNILTGFSLQRIKGAQRRFSERKNKGTRSFVTSSTKPKFAGPLNVAESIRVTTPINHYNTFTERNEQVSWHDINTPFGVVTLKVIYRKNKVIGRIIVNQDTHRGALFYTKIFEILDNLYSDNSDRALALAQQILDYLSTELTLEDVNAPDILARFNSKFRNSLPSDNVEKACATLCAILMFCESCELRNATGVKLERGFIRRVIKNMENRISNPFKTTAEKHYPPHLNHTQSSGDGGVKVTRDALNIDGPQTLEGKKSANGISELGSDVSDDSGKDSNKSSDEDKK